MENVNVREIKGQQIAEVTEFKKYKGRQIVPSQTKPYKSYKVNPTTLECECLDFTFNGQTCKHIYAVLFKQGREKLDPLPEVPAVRYSQDWRAYNKSQTSEKAQFLRLLSELTRNIEEQEFQTTGRPALPLGDMIFSCVFKVYSQMSSRRFTTDIKDAQAKGFINEAPHYNSLIRYMEKKSLTEYLEMLVEETSKPLASLETDFAVDSTGLSISNSVAWSHAKYKDQKMLRHKNWIKVHCCVGTKTNVITGVEISDKTGYDGTYFIPVLETTKKNFNVSEVSADMAYNSNRNFAYSRLNEITPYIPFKDRFVGHDSNTSSTWKQMFHFFNLHRTEFIQHYGKRSNVETAFHMLKSKFGSLLKSRTFEAQKNEALCKVICHNISCLIHSMNEFGIAPEFL